MDLYVVYEREIADINKMQKECSEILQNVSKYELKLNENTMVKNELTLITDSDGVYKMVGPVLMKQDKAEALTTVEKRLDFINGEM
jgi:prefoldin beta subunit